MTARQEYVRSVEAELRSRIRPSQSDEALAQARAALAEAFDDLGRPESREEIEAVFGAPAEFALSLAEDIAAGQPPSRRVDAGAGNDHSELLGIPYEVRVPTAERFASRMWNPADSRLLVPRAFGMGWDLNFGALAVKLRLIRPDDVEEIPFAGVPYALAAALVWGSLGLIFAIATWSLLFAEALPASIPYHFGLSGPDRFAAPRTAVASLLGIPLAGLAAIAFATFVRRSSTLGRGLAAASAPAIALLGAGMWANSLWWAWNGRYLMPTALVVVLPPLLLFGLLIGLTKLGLRKEWRRQGIRL